MCKFNFFINHITIKTKNILITLVKILIGLISFYVIYNRLAQIPHLKEQSLLWLHNTKIISAIIITLLLMPLNWGIECFKWKIITTQVEPISFKTAIKSVFTGICLGNIAPGRAMEFVAKIYFFKSENKPSITILHFINGMFQMLITVTAGICAIAYTFNSNTNNQSSLLFYIIIFGGVILISIFCLAIFNIGYIQNKLKFIKWFKLKEDAKSLSFNKTIIISLLSLSIVRYTIFTMQFYLLYSSFSASIPFFTSVAGIAGYFMLTSIIPMISVIEPAIRAAIALFVFNSTPENSFSIIISSTLLWIINVVLPSGIGYLIILKEKINFKTSK